MHVDICAGTIYACAEGLFGHAWPDGCKWLVHFLYGLSGCLVWHAAIQVLGVCFVSHTPTFQISVADWNFRGFDG